MSARRLIPRTPSVRARRLSFAAFALMAVLAGPRPVIRSRPLSNSDLLANESHRIAPNEVLFAIDLDRPASAMAWYSAADTPAETVDISAARQPAPFDVAGWFAVQGLSTTDFTSPLDLRVSYPSNSEPPEPSRLILPMLIVIFAGVVWRYYHSSSYAKLYETLFGPLDEY